MRKVYPYKDGKKLAPLCFKNTKKGISQYWSFINYLNRNSIYYTQEFS